MFGRMQEPRLDRRGDQDEQHQHARDPEGPRAEDDVDEPAWAGGRERRPGPPSSSAHEGSPSGLPFAAACPVRRRDDPLLGGLVVRKRRHQPSLAHDQDPVGHREHLRQLGGDHQDCHALVRQRGQEAVDLGLGADVDPAGRLVDDQQPWLAGEPLREYHLLLVAARRAMRPDSISGRT